MQKFKCTRCGECCKNLITSTHGLEHGIYLTPDEIRYFPADTIFPLFRVNGKVFSYQLGVSVCPNLVVEEEAACCIYKHRPLICRACPISYSGPMSVCRAVSMETDIYSLSDCIRASWEQARQAESSPQADEIFVLDDKRWVKL